MGKKDGMYCYYDWIKPLSKVPTEDFKKLFIAMIEYHRDGTTPPDFDGLTGMAADFIFPQIQRSKTYAQNGTKGGIATQAKNIGSTVASTNGSSLKHKHIQKTNTKTNTNTIESMAKPSSSRTRIPSLDEVKKYCRERRSTVSAEAFFDFYETNGWRQGQGKPIKDWKAAVRTWERRDREAGKTAVPTENNPDEITMPF